ncbi:MAG: DUF3306 domain-containing protein [Methyloligellaceae bacterium]
MVERDDNFLGRWSRRKVEARQGLRKKAADEAAGVAAPETDDVAAIADDVGTSEMLRDEGSERPPEAATEHPAPGDEGETDRAAEFEDFDFDALDYESDYTRFMDKGVPEAIRRRALRKLWQSNPILANLDGLNDYDEDFTDAALAVDVLQTAYKVGRGYLTDEDLAEMEDDDAEEIVEGDDAGPDTEHDVASGTPEQTADGSSEPAVETPDDIEADRAGTDETA